MHFKTLAAAAAFIVTSVSPSLAAVVANPPPFDDRVWHTFQSTARPFTSAPAPADEYFGRFKLSNLGMRNIIHDMNIEGDSPLALPLQQTRIQEVAGALADWSNHYPRDTWLPGTTASFVKFLERKRSAETAAIAVSFAVYLADRYQGTRRAHWYQALLATHTPVSDIDPTTAPSPFRIYAPFDVDVLDLRVPTLP